MNTENFLSALVLVVLAGMSTVIGSAAALFSRRSDHGALGFALGFSAGVMIYVSFTEILGIAGESLSSVSGEVTGAWYTAAAFFSGILLIGVIDRLVPEEKNPHEMPDAARNRQLKRVGLTTALALGIHNFPEGFATFLASLENPATGLSVAIAIAIHNIPEGIAVSMPVYAATGSRRKAFLWSALSGVSEPVGALAGYFVLRSFFTPSIFGFSMGAVAGIMVFISLDQLLPAAEKYGKHHRCVYGLVAGMAVMALSVLLLGE